MYQYSAQVVRVVDGDTVDFDVDLGFGVTFRERFRLHGIDAPEVRGPEREDGKAATEHLKKLLDDGAVRIETFKDKKGKFGRYLCRIVKGGVDINKQMVVDGHAEEY